MKLSKENISNLVLIVAILLIVFTPVGFYARVLVGKIFASSANVITADKQVTLSEYEWKLQGLDGDLLDFETYQGEVVLVNFWATWCPPCVAELPSLHALYQDYNDRVKFVFVSNEDSEKVIQFLRKKNYDLPSYSEYSRTPKEFYSQSIPATYILSKNGKIVVDEKGAINWNSDSTRHLLDKLLK